ncbi:Gtr1/RagA G protein Gtr2 [Athelia psychrophila]|uniref:GTP-binding protein n=1 Tax=Athelia psychrophila TaxID=1759441 RepID=A0A166M921_9AGAM|nr:Gtr1/RagA G protein Gtr2 [Fibularhizoctonia sp. CBS 109695]
MLTKQLSIAASKRTSTASKGKQAAAPIPEDKSVPAGVQRTKILLLGLRRAGKTSILNVLFNKLVPKQTFYLETTMRITKHTIDTVIPLEIWDCPGNITVQDLGTPLTEFSSMVFVIDIRDVYQQPISRLVDFIYAAHQENPDLNLELFVHKAEKMQEEDKIENFRQIHERVNDRLQDILPDYEQLNPLDFHLTSVYDHSVHEAFSRVLHKLIGSLPYLEDLLNIFCANSSSPKAFLFDTTSRLFVATDASPVDTLTHNLCCDYLNMLNSFRSLYQSKSLIAAARPQPPALPTSAPTSSSRLPSPTRHATNPVSRGASPSPERPLPPRISTSTPPPTPAPSVIPPPFYPSASTSLSPSRPGTTLTYHLLTGSLALLALVPTTVYEMRRGLVEYNVVWLREGVQEIVAVEREGRGG